MSMSFEVFPTNKKNIKCDEINKYSVNLFREFLKRKEISQSINIMVKEVNTDNKVYDNPVYLVMKENCHTVFNLNEEGEVYVFYHKLTELDEDFWNEEIERNKNAQAITEKIYANLELGYSWSVKRTIGQPALVSLYYGFLAIAIAILTNGFIYSDDGSWDYSSIPIEGNTFKAEYLNIEKIGDVEVKENIEKWLGMLRS